MMLETLGASPTFWSEAKNLIEHSFGLSRDGMHIIAGPCVQLIVAASLRTSLRHKWPWVVVLIFATANEWHDLQVERWPSFGTQLGEGLKDVLLTILLPTILLWVSRCYPSLLTGPRCEGTLESEID